MNHASWLDAWDRGLIVPASAAMQWKERSLNRPPSFFSFFLGFIPKQDTDSSSFKASVMIEFWDSSKEAVSSLVGPFRDRLGG